MVTELILRIMNAETIVLPYPNRNLQFTILYKISITSSPNWLSEYVNAETIVLPYLNRQQCAQQEQEN